MNLEEIIYIAIISSELITCVIQEKFESFNECISTTSFSSNIVSVLQTNQIVFYQFLKYLKITRLGTALTESFFCERFNFYEEI